MPYAIGVDLGGTHTKAALVSDDGAMLKTVKGDTPADSGPAAVLARVAELVERVMEALPEGETYLYITPGVSRQTHKPRISPGKPISA